MCGIGGIVGSSAERATLEEMGAAIAHRGPDEGAVLVEPGAGFTFRRLSIIDVAGGHQPIFNENGDAFIILNGEIYNHHELRKELENRGHRFRTHSDAETVLHLWEEEGTGCLRHLRGMFALAIWSRTGRSLFLARDRVGKKPLYFHQLPDGGIVFASEIKAILQHPAIARKPNLAALDQFLTLQYVPAPMTAFQGIQCLSPAHWLLWKDGDVRIERYWRLDFGETELVPEQELREEMLRLLRQAVQIRLESEVPLGAFLSGGVDSSAVVALAAASMTEPLKTFSIGFKEAAFDESSYARRVAERFGTDHHELVVESEASDIAQDIVWHYDQPFGDSSAIPSFCVAQLTKPHVTVVLNGDGGDESFGGYDRYRLSNYNLYFRLPRFVRTSLYAAALPVSRYLGRGQRLLALRPQSVRDAYYATLIHLTPRLKPWLYTDGAMDQFVNAVTPPLAFMRSKVCRSSLDMMLETDINYYLPNDLLVKMDVATMAHSLEARSPFLDHVLMEFMARVPAHLKLREGVSKYLLKSAFRGTLPDEILDRPKMGFGVPLGRWLRTNLRELVVDMVLSTRAVNRGYFRYSSLKTIVDRTFGGSDAFQYLLWDLLMLEMWHRTFIDAPPRVRPAGWRLPSPTTV
jgi:asparagine synthase (glutamine-hydrolysing)